MQDGYDIDDLESFISGLKDVFDSLSDMDSKRPKGFQLKLAKAISELRSKKIDKIEPTPQFDKNGKLLIKFTKEDLKNFFLNELEFLTSSLDSADLKTRRKFELVMKIAKIREKIRTL